MIKNSGGKKIIKKEAGGIKTRSRKAPINRADQLFCSQVPPYFQKGGQVHGKK